MEPELVDLLANLPTGSSWRDAGLRYQALDGRTEVIPEGDLCYEIVDLHKQTISVRTCPYYGVYETKNLDAIGEGYCAWLLARAGSATSVIHDQVKECTMNISDYAAIAAQTRETLEKEFAPQNEAEKIYDRALTQGRTVMIIVTGLVGLGITGASLYVGLKIFRGIQNRHRRNLPPNRK